MSTVTILEYAGTRLANAVEIYLGSRDASALAALKLVFADYRQAERAHAAALTANDLQDGDQ